MSVYNKITPLNIEQLKNAPNFNKVLKVAATAFDELDNVFGQIKGLLNIESVTGNSLDRIGNIVGQKRGDLNDSDYRNLVKLKIFKNTSNGFVNTILQILKEVTNSTKVIYSDISPAAYSVYVNGVFPNDNRIENISLVDNENNLLVDNANNILQATTQVHDLTTSPLTKSIDDLSAAGVSTIIYKSFGKRPLVFFDQGRERNLETLVNNNNEIIVDNFSNIIQVTSPDPVVTQTVTAYEDGELVLNEDGSLLIEESFEVQEPVQEAVSTYELFDGGGFAEVGLFVMVDNNGNLLVDNTGAVMAVEDRDNLIGEFELVEL